MKLNNKQLKRLKTVTQINAVSGDEHLLANYLKNQYSEWGYQLVFDNLGSIFAYKKSKVTNAKKVMLVAHMDEVGFIVKELLSNGCVKVHALGGHNPATLLSNRVILTTRDNRSYYGTINSLPPHLLRGKNDNVSISEMIFDFGFTNIDELKKHGINIGDPIVCEGPFEVLNEGKRLLAKAFDDRIGIALGLEILEYFKDRDLPFDLYVGGSVQEEVGCRGALTSAHLIKPDLAIVVDCSPAKDMAGNDGELGVLGKGVLVRVVDATMIAFKDLINYQIETLKKAKVPYQYYISPGGTDAGSIHKSIDGIKTLTYCLVARSIHTASTIIDTDDYLNARRGMIYLLKHLDFKKIGIE